MSLKFTAVNEQGESGWYVGQIEEAPAALSQGRTLKELRGNLLDALRLIMDTNKKFTEKVYLGKQAIIEKLELA